MAVYTQLEFDEIEILVAPLGLGRLVTAQGIAAGVENSTYFLDFARRDSAQTIGQYVLTIAETLSRDDLTFVARLMHDLNARGLPIPAPISPSTLFDSESAVLSVREKPALLVSRIPGAHPHTATPELCRQIGHLLADLHLATLSLGYTHESHRSLNWVVNTGTAVLSHLPAA
ncbi:MAG TPA: phosphotransferase, partial [Spongiibacteraceae bacterium]|nr:phosphotransferase [Spongiibacteraceae bacterium]